MSVMRHRNAWTVATIVGIALASFGVLSTVAWSQGEAVGANPEVPRYKLSECPPHESVAPPTGPPDLKAMIAAGSVTVGDHCGTAVGTMPFPFDMQAAAVPVTGFDGTVVGYFVKNGGYIQKDIYEAPDFDLAEYQRDVGITINGGPKPGEAPSPSARR